MEARPETWKRVRCWPRYEVSDMGRVRNRVTGRVLQPTPLSSKAGHRYLRLTLYALRRGGRRERKHVYVHRLVALYHVAGRTRYRCQVDHLSRDTNDNRAGNLEWVTPIENLRRRHPHLYPCLEADRAYYDAIPAEAPF